MRRTAWSRRESMQVNHPELSVESVSDDGNVVLRFFGGTSVVVQIAPELARFYRRLVDVGIEQPRRNRTPP